MKKTIVGMLMAAGLLLACPPVQGADYSRMTTAELAAMRGTLQNAPLAERRDFEKEWQRRVRRMNTAERLQYLGPQAEAPTPARPRLEEKRLVSPPASVGPRRFGERVFQKQERHQIGPPRFAPTPDLDGRGSPFDFGHSPAEKSVNGQRR